MGRGRLYLLVLGLELWHSERQLLRAAHDIFAGVTTSRLGGGDGRGRNDGLVLGLESDLLPRGLVGERGLSSSEKLLDLVVSQIMSCLCHSRWRM